MRCYGEVRHCGWGSLPASRDHESWCDPTVAAFCTKPGKTSPMLHFARAKKIAKVAPALLKMVQENDEHEWFKMQV